MPVVPKYQERERLAPLPDLKTHVSGAPFAASASGARELGEAGRGLSRLGDALFVKAEREREEDERVEFMKLRALREAEVESVVQRESESDDYQTLSDRVNAAMADYDKKTADGLQGKRMQKLYGNLVEVGNASLAPKLAGIQQKRRIDGLSADALLAVNTAVQNKRWDEAAAYIENTPDSVWDKEKKAHLISNLDKSRKEYETVVSAQNEAQRLFDKYGVDGIAQALAEVRETHEGQEEDRYISYLNSYYTDKVQERNATYKQTRTSLTDTYLRTGALPGIDLRALVDEGKLDPEGALMWSERLKADQERRRAEAERAAYRAAQLRSERERNAAISSAYNAAQAGNMSALAQSLNSLDERDFKKALRVLKLPPISKQLLEASYKYGQDPKYFMDNYNDMLTGIADGSYDEDQLAQMKAYGMLTPIQEAEASRLLKERNGAPGAVAIKINYRQEFDKKMEALKIPEDQRDALRDRFNYDALEEKRKNGGYLSNVKAGKMMDELLASKVIGQTYSSWGTKKPVMVPAGLLPPGTKWDADGTAYLPDEYQNKHNVTVPGTPKLLPPRSEQEIYEEQQNRKNRFGGRM